MTDVCGLLVSFVTIFFYGKMVRLFVWLSILTLTFDIFSLSWHL